MKEEFLIRWEVIAPKASDEFERIQAKFDTWLAASNKLYKKMIEAYRIYEEACRRTFKRTSHNLTIFSSKRIKHIRSYAAYHVRTRLFFFWP